MIFCTSIPYGHSKRNQVTMDRNFQLGKFSLRRRDYVRDNDVARKNFVDLKSKMCIFTPGFKILTYTLHKLPGITWFCCLIR